LDRALGTLGEDDTLTMIDIVFVLGPSEKGEDLLLFRNTETSETFCEVETR